MFRIRTLTAAGIILSAVNLGAASITMAATEPAKLMATSKGKIWVTPRGMALYTFSKDTAGKSNCTGLCAVAWPPFMASANAKASGEWSLVTRSAGSKQWAYNGKPLYTFIKDTKPGEVTGNGDEGFYVAK